MSRWRWQTVLGGMYVSWSNRAKQYFWKMNLGKIIFLGVSKSIFNVDMFSFVWNTFLSTSPLEKESNGEEGKDNKEDRRGKDTRQAWKAFSPGFFKIISGSGEVEMEQGAPQATRVGIYSIRTQPAPELAVARLGQQKQCHDMHSQGSLWNDRRFRQTH